MRKIFASVVAVVRQNTALFVVMTFAALCRDAATAQTTILFTNQTMIGTTNDTTIAIKADSNPIIWNGTFYWLPPNGTNLVTTNGVGQIALVPGSYTASFAGVPASFKLFVTNSTAPLSAAAIANQIVFYSGVQSLTAAGGIAIYPPTGGGGNWTISNKLSGAGITNALGTNASSPSVNASTVFVPTNYDAAGAAQAIGANATNSFLQKTNDAAYGLHFGSPVLGLGTNQNLGEFWLPDWGFSPTNTAAGNAAALDACILACSNAGGGIIRYGSRFATSPGGSQVIQLSGEHLFPNLGAPRIKLKGDGASRIQFTSPTTVHAVFYGMLDVEDVILYGTGTNSSDAYPYTNNVGIWEIGYNDPVLRNVYVTGFGQGIVCEQLGSFRGAKLDHCEAENCDIGMPVGDQCDKIKFEDCAARGCGIGWDIACVTPSPAGLPYFSSIFYGGTNVSGSSGAEINGGIADYNGTACIVGKGVWKLGFYAGNTKYYQMQIGHPSNLPIAYPNQGASVLLERCVWDETPVNTNILVNTFDNSVIQLRQCQIGGSGSWYGIIGQAAYVDCDSGSLSCNTNYWPSTFFPITDAAFRAVDDNAPPNVYFDYGLTLGSSPDTEYFNIGYVNGQTLWRRAAVASDKSVRSQMSYIFNYGTNDQLYLNNMSLVTTKGVTATGNLAMGTNSSAPVPISQFGIFYLSNYDLYWVTPTKTNLVVLGH